MLIGRDGRTDGELRDKMHASRRNTETASKFVVKGKVQYAKRQNESSYDNGACMQFLATVSHSIPWVLTYRHCD